LQPWLLASSANTAMNEDIPLTLHSFPRAVIHIDGDAFFD
jgi:hypothetical protein